MATKLIKGQIKQWEEPIGVMNAKFVAAHSDVRQDLKWQDAILVIGDERVFTESEVKAMRPVAFWQRWWSGDRDKNRKYHSNKIIPNFGGISLSGNDYEEMARRGPYKTETDQWTEIVPLFAVLDLSGTPNGG
jgi:hypothetical protein